MTHGVSRPKDNALTAIFGRSRGIVIGVIHSKPLPGSPSFAGESLDEIYAFAVDEGRRYADAGVDGLILENHGDIPFARPEEIGVETAATMAVMADWLHKAVGLPLGINVLANAAIPAVAVAQASGAAFVRVNQWANAYVANEGIIQGPAGRAARYRAWVRASHIRIFADVHVKHGAHAIVADRSIAELTRDLEFFDADVVIVTGQRTGDPPSIDELREVREATPLPLVIGSGMTEDDVERLLSIADGVIIGSALKHDGVWWNPVDPQRANRFVARVRSL